MPALNFAYAFRALTGNDPFPWQTELYQRLIQGGPPAAANIPTGLGKTSIVAIWLIALAQHPDRIPRRLVYVVNRRTVVDQTTAEAEKLRATLAKSELAEIRAALADLCALPLPRPDSPPLAISTLRGQFADNGEWCVDPSRPAIVIGTVDMIGSGLLFCRYTRGFKTRPLHAGFLAQDTLLIHDEAHLEPAFQTLLEEILSAQEHGADLRKLRVIELTATSRTVPENGAAPFALTDDDRENETVKRRINAAKRLALVGFKAGEKLDAKLVECVRALVSRRSGARAVLVFTQSVADALKVADKLNKGKNKGKVTTLTGTLRGKERDALVTGDAVFQRFLPPQNRASDIAPATGIVYLVATSAGEVGVNFSADDLVCDLSTYDSMAQRFGRVNRFGERDDSEITVVYPKGKAAHDFDGKHPRDSARVKTYKLLSQLAGDASPAALDRLPARECAAAFSPLPRLRAATEIQFDAWALTSIREPIAARPPVAPYLHGEAEWQPPETHLAWRDDRDFQYIANPADFLENFPLQPRELLRDTTERIVTTLKKLLSGKDSKPSAWLVAADGSVSVLPLTDFDKDAAVTDLAEATLILPVSLGGLENGLFTGKGEASDVSGIERRESDVREEADFALDIADEDADEPRYLLWFAPQANRPTDARLNRGSASESLASHSAAVEANASALAEKLLAPDLGRLLILAARLHDLGKNRAQWQHNLGNRTYNPADSETILAKSAAGMSPRGVAEHYRHEFGSLRDATARTDFTSLKDEERDVVLHLIAAHHGRARPHFPGAEIFDYAGNDGVADRAAEVPRRFARLQKRFGRWGLAWLESLLRAADYAASAGLVARPTRLPGAPAAAPSPGKPRPPARPVPTVSLVVDPINPGQFFACCGLFELAARHATHAAGSPPVRAWFELDAGARQGRFHLAETISLTDLLAAIIRAEIEVLDDADNHSAVKIVAPFNLHLDWWRYEDRTTGKLKTWAGQMKASTILATLREVMSRVLPLPEGQNLFAVEALPTKAVSCFDAPRSTNTAARDVGFSIDRLKKGQVVIRHVVHPFLEFFCLIGLQRVRPIRLAGQLRAEQAYAYHWWHDPLPVSLLPVAAIGQLPDRSAHQYQFANPSRTQDYRAFMFKKTVLLR